MTSWKTRQECILCFDSQNIFSFASINQANLSLGFFLIIESSEFEPSVSRISEKGVRYFNGGEGLRSNARGKERFESNVNAREFKDLKQEEGETARDFCLRTKIAAQKIELTNQSLIVANFVDGLRDAEVKSCAKAFNLSMDDVLAVATRREAAGTKNFPWKNRTQEPPLAVAAVSNESSASVDGRQGGGFKRGRFEPYVRGAARGTTGRSLKEEVQVGNNPSRVSPCPKWGRRQHRYPGCPAESAACRKCKKVGHFEVVCRAKKINNLQSSEQVRDESD